MRWRWLLVAALLLPAASLALWAGLRRSEAHVVLISIDTLRRDHLPTYGYARPTAPRIDGLARESVVFDEDVATHTNTAPSHASMLTGLYPPTHGILQNGDLLRAEVPTLPELLKATGYRTGGFVSGWTLKGDFTGLNRGFDRYHDRFPLLSETGGQPRRAYIRHADETFERAHRWLTAEAARPGPLFVFYHLFDPHYPYDPPDDYLRRFLPAGQTGLRFPRELGPERTRLRSGGRPEPGQIEEYIARYDGEIAFADEYVGRLLDDLRSLGLYDRSIIVLTADHGETLDDRPFVFSHGDRDYEEQVRVPLVVRFPGGRYGGQRVAAPVQHVDILPTVLDYLKIAAPEGVQGRSLMPIIAGRATPEPRPAFSLARGEPDWAHDLDARIVQNGLVASVRLPPLKLVQYPTASGHFFELFDLSKDPGEKHNLATERPELTQRLHAELERWLQATRRGGTRQTESGLSPEAEEALRSLGYLH